MQVRFSFFVLIYMISLNTPYALAQIGLTKGIFIGVRLVCTGMMLLFCWNRRMKCNKFDLITIFFCGFFLISAVHAGTSSSIAVAPLPTYFYNAISRIVFVLGQLLVIKIIFGMQKEVSRAALKTIFWYYTALCVINLTTQVLGMELVTKTGNTFFLGLDNEVGKYYLYAVFYCCVDMIMEEKRDCKALIIVTMLVIIEGYYRKIGGLTVISIILAVSVALLCLAPCIKIWQMRHDVLLGIMIGAYVLGMFSFTGLDTLRRIINTYLYGKANALQVRFDLQARLLSQWIKSPLFGWGSSIGGVKWGDSSWFDYALAGGHAHNFFIDSLYNYGIFSFISYLYLLLLAVRKIRGKGTIVSFLGLVFLLIVLRGMFENGCQNIFSVLPALYYLGDMLDKQKTVVDKEQVCDVQRL